MTRFITEDIEISSGDDNDNPDFKMILKKNYKYLIKMEF